MSSSNLVNITKKRALDKFQARVPIGLIISWLTNWKRGSFIVFTFHKFQVETSWRGPWRIEHEKVQNSYWPENVCIDSNNSSMFRYYL